MPLYPLVPGADIIPTGDPRWQPLMSDEIHPPESWKPRAADISPFTSGQETRDPAASFPTPFYRMEATRAALVAEQGGGYLELWNTAAMALAAGVLRVRPLDLHRAGGLFGERLAKLDPKRRFLAQFSAEIDGQQRLFAISDPETLLWPAARRTREEWNKLSSLVTARQGRALDLLADFAAVMQEAREWDEGVPWMNGIARLIRNVRASDGLTTYRQHACGVGPLALTVKGPDGRERSPVYFPVAAEGWGTEIRRLATMRFRRGGAGDEIRAFDLRDVDLFLFRVPADADRRAAIYSGIGVAERIPNRVPDWPPWKDVRLEQDDGLFAHLKGYVYEPGMRTEYIRSHPHRYPDPVRVLVDALGPAGLPSDIGGMGAVLSYGPETIAAALEKGISLPGRDEIAPEQGFVHQASGRSHCYLESEKDYGATELRAIGWALWQVFLGNVDAARGGDRPEILISDRAAMQVVPGGRLATHCYEALDEDYRAEEGKRVAALQRFARVWKLGETPPVDSQSVEVLLRAAAHVWVRWLTGARPFPNGPVSGNALSWEIYPNQSVGLPIDVEASTEP